MGLLNMIVKWIKRIFSDTHSAIVSLIVVFLLTGTGSIYLFCKNLWNWLGTTLLSPTPLWVTTVSVLLVLLVSAYLHVKTAKSNQPSALPLKSLTNEDIKALQIIASLEQPFEKNRYIGQSTLPNLLNLSPQKTQHCLDNLLKADCIHYDTDNYGTYLRGLTDKGRSLLERKNLLP